jgi:hypothetical protein
MTDTNCNCPEGTFPYRVNQRDVDAYSGENTNKAVAERYGLSADDVDMSLVVEDTPDAGLTQPQHALGYKAGDIICLPLDALPIGYRSPCEETLPSALDIALYTELLTLISYAEMLGLAAQMNIDTVDEPAVNILLESENFYNVQLAKQILTLAENAGFEDIEQVYEIIGHDSLNAEAMIASSGINSVVLGDEYDRLEELNESLDFYALHDLLNEVYTRASQNEEYSNSSISLLDRAEERINLQQDAIDQDVRLMPNMEEVRAILANWNEIADDGLLNGLNSKISQMLENEVLLGVSVRHIIDAFDRFYTHMRSRHDLLKGLKENLAEIDYLMLTPEERINLAKQEAILAELQRLRDANPILADYLIFDHCADLTWEDFQMCLQSMLTSVWQIPEVREALEDNLFGGTRIQDDENVVMGEFLFQNFEAHTDPIDPEVREQQAEEARQRLSQIFFVAGFIPGVGAFIDLVSAVVAFARGNYGEAAFNLFFAAIDIDDLFELGRRMAGLNDIADDLIQQAEGELDEYIQNVVLSRQGVRQLEDNENILRSLQNPKQVAVSSNNKEIWQTGLDMDVKDFPWIVSQNYSLSSFEQELRDKVWVVVVDHKGVRRPIPVEIGALYDTQGNVVRGLHGKTEYAFDASGRPILGQSVLTLPSPSDLNIAGFTLTHLHPSGDTFSHADISNLFRRRLLEIRAVDGVTGGVYSVRVNTVHRIINGNRIAVDIANVPRLAGMELVTQHTPPALATQNIGGNAHAILQNTFGNPSQPRVLRIQYESVDEIFIYEFTYHYTYTN